MDLLDRLTVDDLTGEQRELAETIGLEAYKKLVRYVNGDFIYIAQEDSITKGARNEDMRMEFNGYNYRGIARKYKMTVRNVRNIVDGRGGLQEGQQTMFDKENEQ